MISLTASADYGLSGQYIARITGRHPKFTFDREFIGRKGGKRNEVTEADVDDPGLYECCDIDKKHGKDSRFMLVLEVGDTLVEFKCDKEDAMIVAKALDAGRPLNEIASGHMADPEAIETKKGLSYLKGLAMTENSLVISQQAGQFTAGSTVDQATIKSEIDRLSSHLETLNKAGKFSAKGYELLSKKEAEKKQATQTIQTATEGCLAILQSLPTKDAKKVLAELKNKINPV